MKQNSEDYQSTNHQQKCKGHQGAVALNEPEQEKDELSKESTLQTDEASKETSLSVLQEQSENMEPPDSTAVERGTPT